MAILPRSNPNQRFEDLKRAALSARASFDRDAWLNLAFYLDQQYVEWHEGTGAIRQIPRQTGEENLPRPIVNKIMHFVQTERALVLQAKPTADVLPATDDIIAISDAAVAKAYTTYMCEPSRANFTKQLSRATLWAIICGDGYLKWVWNPLEKRVDIIPCSLFEIASDPYATDFAKSRYVIHSKFMDKEQVFDAYGVEVKDSDVETVDPTKTALLRGMGASPVVKGVTINELWYKPCRKYAEGLYTVWAGSHVLVPPQKLPYNHKRLPFTQIGCIERPDSQHYMSPVKYLRSAQMELNKYHAQRLMIREAFAAPKWGVPVECEMEEMPNSSPRQVLRYSAMNGAKPELFQPATYPPNDDGAMIETQMMHIVGLHEVSNAQVPGRVEAAKAIEMLKESDADRQATMLDTIDATIAEGFWQGLQLAKQFETADKMVQIYSRDGLPEVKQFRAETVDPAMRIVVTMGTGLAKSRAARQDQLMNMWQNRIITDPELMAELMEVPFPSFTAPKMLDARLARNENIEISRGVAVVPNSWDDHAIHLREHNDYRKTHDYLMATMDVKQKFEFHCQQHAKFQQDAMMQQMQMMQAVQGGAQPGGDQPPAPSADPAQSFFNGPGFPQFFQPTPRPHAPHPN